MEGSEFFPYGDIVGAEALFYINKKENLLTYELTRKLLEDEPELSQLSEGSRIVLSVKDVGLKDFIIGEGSDETITGDIHSWLILSHFASYTSLKIDECFKRVKR